jgi:hypothetical protein
MARIDNPKASAAIAEKITRQYLEGCDISRQALSNLVPDWMSPAEASAMTGVQESKIKRFFFAASRKQLKPVVKEIHDRVAAYSALGPV